MTEANAEMARYWNEVSGPKWVALQELIDRQIGPLGERAFARAALSLGLAFIISLAIGPWVIRRLAALKAGQVIRKSLGAGAVDLSAMHGKKAGTPTMGGLLILIAMLAPVLLFCRLTSVQGMFRAARKRFRS
jgi:phospho-N-acetylmuramoyl-pentapeptide-transferase